MEESRGKSVGDGSGVKDECVVTVMNPKLAHGEYMQSAEKDGKYFTRFVFVTPKTEIEGKGKATFTAHYNGNDYTFETPKSTAAETQKSASTTTKATEEGDTARNGMIAAADDLTAERITIKAAGRNKHGKKIGGQHQAKYYQQSTQK